MARQHEEFLDLADVPAVVELDARRASLEMRLEDGFRRIDEAVLAGDDVSGWETFWISLLREYEDVCRGQDLAA
jgi:hypothetical protein